MIDLHCHFLPGVDDGARTMHDALALAAASVANGITHAVLTPHIHPGCFDNRLATLAPVFSNYRASLTAAGIDLQVFLGAEVRLHPDALDLLAADDLPVVGTVGLDRVVLLEFPDGQIPAGAETACRYFADRGVRWLIAHPERNKEVMRDPMRIKPFVDNGCLLQVTAASVVGRFGPNALKTSHMLLAKGLVAVVATDSHNLLYRPPLLNEAREAISRLYGSGLAHRLTEETPAGIIQSRLQPGV
jgi:protein-tyrosine phosphatase